ncbi:MAG: cell division protein ZapE [Gammaproteobacteria bacterium]|nr:cell division protein ZapE [Gammaproteobacteria bacterium]
MPSPLEKYNDDQQQMGFSADLAQAEAVDHLQRLYLELCDYKKQQGHNAKLSRKLALWAGRNAKKCTAPRGLYLWGGVGRGKTYLMDVFFECLPFEDKQRTHFHRFMRHVHERLTVHKGIKNPLLVVAQELAEQARVICFDEFFVTDITDAMILAHLLESLFDLGVVLVATSNIEPMRLYENGLQRQRFLPAITMLEAHTNIVNVDGGVDYRLRTLSQAELYHWPIDDQADISLSSSFSALAPMSTASETLDGGVVVINAREFRYVKQCDDIIWLTFHQLCVLPRSQNDYLELACEFHSLIISNVPCLTAGMDDQARRFVNLVDVCYDANLKVIISAEVPLLQLYAGGPLDFVFQRTLSRLQEMQSHEYLARGHIAG